jgi:hypothetical protein
MKALIAVFSDGQRYMLTVVPAEFDTQKWANERAESFRMLEIVRIIEDVR